MNPIIEPTAASNLIANYLRCVDRRDWDGVICLMKDPFYLDYSSYGAGAPAELSPDSILNEWAKVLPGFDSTQHLTGNLSLAERGGKIEVEASVIATHYIKDVAEGETWTVYGDYVFQIEAEGENLKLAGCVFHYGFQTGNTKLPSMAAERCRDSQN